MAGSSLLALIDDIASILDDVSVLTQLAARKTVGVLGDDLALNAQQVAGVRADRELPVVWAVARGSLINKLILVPAALILSAFAPWAVTPLLMVGGVYLCYEGFEKISHRLTHSPRDDAAHHAELARALADPSVDLVVLEKAKIKGAVRTDFILSAEIIIIALGTVAAAPFLTQVIVLSGIAVVMTVGVYGLVAGIVKLDDAGLFLSRREGVGIASRLQRSIGVRILALAPYLMKTLSIAGTAAMFLVGGGILTHGIPVAHRLIESLAQSAATVPGVGAGLVSVAPWLLNALLGVATGAVALVVVRVIARVGTRRDAGNTPSD
ncbi:MAG: DUF808 domain-containing protein [Betaproteobacteria bacterium]